ncbi:MAG: insulinase family protein [Asticcacaulis sp.]
MKSKALALILAHVLAPVLAAGLVLVGAGAACADPLKVSSSGAQFAHLHSDLPVDPQARFGRLPNGLTYVLYPNSAEPGKVVMRLRIGAGPLDEADEDSGIANLITYMAFSGSAHYPDGNLFRELERQGIKMGAGQQALASGGETTYQISLPRNDATTLDTGFFVMQDMAFGLSFPEATANRDRAIVVTQIANQAQPLERHYENWLRTAFGGQLLPERPQTGLRDIVLYAPRVQITGFYDTFYRPELATLVIVGDIDTDAMEKRIRKGFGDWKAKTADYPRRDPGVYAPKGPRGYAYAEPGLPEMIDIAWLKPAETRYQTLDQVGEMMADQLALRALGNRLERLSARPDSPFTRAGLNTQHFQRTGDSLNIMVVPRPGDSQAALTEALNLARQAGTYGFSEAEYARAAADYEASLKQRADGAATRPNEWIADMIAGSIEGLYVINSPAQDLQFFTQLKPRLTLEAVNARMKAMIARDGPLIAVIGPAPVAGLDPAGIERTYAALEKTPVPAPEAEATRVWAYTDFGTPAAPVKTERDDALDTTRLTYANGVTVNLKTTRWRANEVMVSVRAQGGLQRLSPKTPNAVFALNFYDLFQGGLGKMSANEAEASLAGMNFDFAYRLTDDAAILFGNSTTGDFLKEMQLIRAFYSDAGFDPAYLERLRHSFPGYFSYAASNPNGVLALHMPRLISDGDARLSPMTQGELQTLGNDTLASLVRSSLRDTPVDITIVGDITVEQARPALDAAFGTLPALPKRFTPSEDARTTHFPTSNLYRTLYHQGSPEQALMMIAFPTTDRFSDVKTSLGLDLLAEIISQRHYEAGRAEIGTTYVPLARHAPSTGFRGFGYLSATVQLYPGAETAFYTGFLSLIDGVKSTPVTPDELLRARQLLLARMNEEDRSNSYWLNVLPGAEDNPGQRDYALKRKALLEAITPAEIQALAKTWLDASKALKVVVLPVPKADARAS